MWLRGSIRLADFFMTVLVECVLFVVWTMTVAICDLRSRRGDPSGNEQLCDSQRPA